MQQGTDILLIDAYSQIFRSFYAVRSLTNSKGQPTNAVFAFTRLMLKLYEDYPTPYGAFILDCGKPAFRLELAPEYKANRPPMPEELRQQIPLLEELASAFGWPLIVKTGFEADDLLAAIAADFADKKVRFISSDKDLAQIIDDRVEMLVPAFKGGGFLIRGYQEAVDKFQVKPEQMVDYLALIGDSSDNIPGIQGIGPKTAAKLINEHGSIAAMLAHPETLENPKLREQIIANAELLARNIKLITLNTEISDKPWNGLASLTRKTPDWYKIRRICEEMELKSILRDLPADGGERDLFAGSNSSGNKEKSGKFAPDLFD
ncbi:MAG: 5'-3' exonuclease H3TH domain-containing protein [Victivallales bacterium]|nr:5'-3' exonuclease H3TH domain-containing protein [Victivallales bacterium]